MNKLSVQKRPDLIYDIGMHKGEDTEFYLRKGFKVVGFDANPELISYCKKKFGAFVESGLLTIIEGAIVDSDHCKLRENKALFYTNEKESVWGTACCNWADRNTRSGASSKIIEVDLVDFVEIVQRYGIPHYMKIDIEGCDMVCLNALKNFYERPDYISIESDKTSYSKIKHEIQTFVSLGYTNFHAIEQSSIPASQTPPYPPKEGKYSAHVFKEGSSGLFGAEISGNWKSNTEILRKYQIIRLGYFLYGEDGIFHRWRFKGAHRLRALTCKMLQKFTKEVVPGWYDTHARHGKQSSSSA